MLNYNKRNRIIVSIVISIIILILVNFILIKFINNQKKDQNNSFVLKAYEVNSNENSNKNNNEEEKNVEIKDVEMDKVISNQYKQNDWRIFIPTLNLDAPILDGTSQENLRKAVCHFENTPILEGNVCLAAHNRGYKYNFFQQINKLEIGDIIKYQKGQILKDYSVMWKGKIKETDLSYTENTKENILTLFTCVENMPEYRLCVQAYQIN